MYIYTLYAYIGASRSACQASLAAAWRFSCLGKSPTIHVYIHINTYIHIYIYAYIQVHHGLPVKRDWLPPGAFLASENHLLNKLWSKESEYELVKLYVSLAKEPCKRDDILQRASMSWCALNRKRREITERECARARNRKRRRSNLSE